MATVNMAASEERPNGITGRIIANLAANLRYRSFWSEISGALGDLGTFIPIAIALTLVNGLDLGTTLIATGIYNAATGLLFGVPMPVQPMKAIAAAALAQSSDPPLSVPQIMAAGVVTAALLFVLGVTGLMGLVVRLVPLPVVRGIQLSQGLALANTAVKYVLKEQNLAHSKTLGSSSHRPWLGLDGILLALLAFCFIVLMTGSGDGFLDMPTHHNTTAPSEVDINACPDELTLARPSSKRAKYLKRMEAIPTALIVVLLGIALAFARKPSILHSLSAGPSAPQIIRISRNDWKIGFLRGAVPQIPLSILNSVIAVCKLSADLFPDKVAVSPRAVSASVGLMNLVGCWFGALPVCHGCGGLAGQCRFGARSGAAVVFLGAGKLITGMLLGGSLVKVLVQFPVGLLGVLLLFSGVELAMACRDQRSRVDSFVMLVCTVASLGSSNAALGFAWGLLLYILLHLRKRGFLPCCRILKELVRDSVGM